MKDKSIEILKSNPHIKVINDKLWTVNFDYILNGWFKGLECHGTTSEDTVIIAKDIIILNSAKDAIKGAISDTGDLLNLDSSNIANDAANIANNTGAIKDSVTASEEDLKYLRDLAEAEVINRYTTNEIKIEMGGVTNNISKETDLDGVMEYFANSLQEAMENAAEGTHI